MQAGKMHIILHKSFLIGVSTSISFPLLVILALLHGNFATTNVNLTSRQSTFRCINGKYTKTGFFCDDEDDCGDASDESYGCDFLKCGAGNFTCALNFQCLPIDVRCNGTKECSDGSDEKFCDHEPPLDDCKVSNSKFLCNDKKRCIDLINVCDLYPQCFDHSDEGPRCYEYNATRCNTCPYPCFRSPTGPQCLSDVDESSFPGTVTYCDVEYNFCDQKCIRLKNHRTQCSCEENFNIAFAEYETIYCEENEKDKNMLIYVIDKKIKGIPGYSNKSIELASYNGQVMAISAANGYVFWAVKSADYTTIAKTPLSGGLTEDVFKDGVIGDVNAMDVDWRTGNIYYIDNTKKRIAACAITNKRCIEVYSLEENATSITLAPRVGLMFWSMLDNEYGFVIKKSDMNGLNYENLVNEGLGDIYSISADEAAEKLYWLDSTRRKIEMVRFDGRGRKVYNADLRMNYLSITVNARYVYWNLVQNGSLYYFSSSSRIRSMSAFNGTEPISLIYGYSYSEKHTTMEAPCSWGCNDGICLMHHRYRNKTGSKCICANATQILSDGWCRNVSRDIISDGYGYYYGRLPRRYGYGRINEFESPHRGVRVILIITSFGFLVSAISFYLYKKGAFRNFNFFHHATPR